MADVCDGDLEPLFGIIEDGTADEFIRSEMLEALAILALQDSPTGAIHPRATPIDIRNCQRSRAFFRPGFASVLATATAPAPTPRDLPGGSVDPNQ